MSLLPVSFCEDLFSGDRDFKCDIYEKDNKYFVEMDIVGYDKKDINVSIQSYTHLKAISKQIVQKKKQSLKIS
jgi:HSP20 family molecular chaperone IbpA